MPEAGGGWCSRVTGEKKTQTFGMSKTSVLPRPVKKGLQKTYHIKVDW